LTNSPQLDDFEAEYFGSTKFKVTHISPELGKTIRMGVVLRVGVYLI